MAVSLYLVAVVVIAVFFYYKKLYEHIYIHYHRVTGLWGTPGPFAFPIIGAAWQFPLDIVAMTKRVFDWGDYYARQGNGTVTLWVGPVPLVMVIRPEEVKDVMDSNELITKGIEYDVLMPWLGTGLLTSTGGKWRSRRKMLTPTFHFNILQGFLVTHDEEAKVLIKQLEKFAETGEEFDAFPYLKRCALDIICATSMGITVKAQINHTHPYVFSVQRLNELTFLHIRSPWLWLKPIWYASGYGKEYDGHLKIVTDFTRKVIDENIQAHKKKKATPVAAENKESKTETEVFGTAKKRSVFLDMLVELHDEGKLNYEDIREEVDTFMFEGHDTTSASMGWTLWCLAHSAEAQNKVIEEVDSIFGDSDRDCTSDDLKELHYLEQCIKESLRLFPSVPIYTRNCTEDSYLNGKYVPKGASIGIVPLILHRNPMIWGENANEFDPDRFSEEEIAKRHAYAYVPFSAGPRNCIGQKFAIMEEKAVLSWFFRKYTVSASKPFDAISPQPEIIIKPNNGFPLSVHKRVR